MFELMGEHVVETGDLAMLCFEVMIEKDASIDDILLRCCARYEKKLVELNSSV